MLQREDHVPVTNRRAFLHSAAIAGASLVAAGATVAALAAPTPQFPRALRAEAAVNLNRIWQQAKWHREDELLGDPHWQLSAQSLREHVKGSLLRFERSPDTRAYVGHTGEKEWDSLVCVAYLPEGIDPQQELELLAWALAYHWINDEPESWTHCHPSVWGSSHFETECAGAVLAGFRGEPLPVM